MNATTGYALGSVIAISLLSFVGLFTFRVKEDRLNRVVYYLIALSVGALFGDTVFHLLPQIYGERQGITVSSLAILAGIFVFFILEKYLHWTHRHDTETAEEGESRHHIEPVGYLSLVSDSFHNFTDGLIIAASYLTGLEVGIATTVAVILHEIPHELGEFGLLLYSGFTKGRALMYNFLSGLFAVLGCVIVLYFGITSPAANSFILSLAAGGFIYIAGSDLVPELHKTVDFKKSLIQLAFIVAGASIMFALLLLE